LKDSRRAREQLFESQLAERDRMINDLDSEVAALQAELHRQRVEMTLADMGDSRKWAELFLKDDLLRPVSEEALADWIRGFGLEQ
jgi:hypothetical protein